MKQMKQLRDMNPEKKSNVTLYQRVTEGMVGTSASQTGLGSNGIHETGLHNQGT